MQAGETLQTLGGKQLLFTQSWMPVAKPKALLFIVHGAAEHSGRYAAVAEYFVQQGFAVFALDHIGHGKSAGDRCYVRSMREYIQPLHHFIQQTKRSNPGVPALLLGHSMGGLITALYLLSHQSEITAAVLTAPAVMGEKKPTLKKFFKALLLAIVAPKTGFLQLDANAVSRDPAVVQAYRNDPLVYSGKMPVAWALAMNSGMGKLKKHAAQIRLPILIAQGGADKLVSPKGAAVLTQWLGSLDKTHIEYPGMYHEILNEPEREKVLQDIADWFKQRLNKRN